MVTDEELMASWRLLKVVVRRKGANGIAVT
jgi:hypothetical protein